MDWYDATEKYHQLTFARDGSLSSLPEEWQRELATLWRLEADVNNGAYLQFLQNWGEESYTYASQALKKIGAHRMGEIVDCCQALIDEHFDTKGKSPEEKWQLLPNPVIDLQGNLIKESGSVLPESILARINELSYEFMKYPEDLLELGSTYYRAHIEGES